jgi:hypothetical protein
MALIECAECKTEVSDRAANCPKCGHPLQEEVAQPLVTASVGSVASPVSSRPAHVEVPSPSLAGTSVPGGLVLGPGEQVIATASFMFSLLHFFLASKFVLTNRRLAGERPNTWLGLIPVGSEKISYPLANIASVRTSTLIQFLPLIVGGLLVLVGLGSKLIVLTIIGALLAIGAFQAGIVITNNGGEKVRLKISLFQKGAAQKFMNEINTAIAGHRY